MGSPCRLGLPLCGVHAAAAAVAPAACLINDCACLNASSFRRAWNDWNRVLFALLLFSEVLYGCALLVLAPPSGVFVGTEAQERRPRNGGSGTEAQERRLIHFSRKEISLPPFLSPRSWASVHTDTPEGVVVELALWTDQQQQRNMPPQQLSGSCLLLRFALIKKHGVSVSAI
jgi:hypothetical protein